MVSAARKQAIPQAAGVDTQQALEAFRDPCFRLSRLYSIRTRDGSVIKFAPRPQQAQIIDLILPERVQADHHPEGEAARLLDALGRHLRGPALLRVGAANFANSQTIEDARQKLRDIVVVAYDSLDPALKRELPITRSNTGELAVKFALETPEEEKGPLDWRVVFFDWQSDKSYCDALPRPIGEETKRYFAGCPPRQESSLLGR